MKKRSLGDVLGVRNAERRLWAGTDASAEKSAVRLQDTDVGKVARGRGADVNTLVLCEFGELNCAVAWLIF